MWDVERYTLVGWLVFIANMAACVVVVPLLLYSLCPGVLEAGGRIQRYTLVAGFLVLGSAGFCICRWLLERVGIVVQRPPQG